MKFDRVPAAPLAPSPFPTRAASRPAATLRATVLALLLAAVALPAAPAHAGPSSSTHPIPGGGSAGVTVLCGPDQAYSCTTGGYGGQSAGWPGARYGAGIASANSHGYHNCTLYAAYRLAANGLADPGWNDNANAWDTRAPGTLVDQNPAVGAIAQWNSGYGHVAYVEVVHPDYIEITDDSYGSNVTRRLRIARTSPTWPDNFIHLRDVVVVDPVTATDVSAFYRYDGDQVNLWTWHGQPGGVSDPVGSWTASGWDATRILPAGKGDLDGDGTADLATFYRHDGGMLDMNVWYGTAGGFTLARPWHI
ncbi:CHAP domain-containing protein, partial [Catellatospora methionotrophica]|uniref:CHAP domain-containing protein n=1 Tax=Catellatospora methionotrophica TaxID=121620 RepID=UPI0033C3B37A